MLASEERMLNEVPSRGAPMPPTDPLLYRLYELVTMSGTFLPYKYYGNEAGIADYGLKES